MSRALRLRTLSALFAVLLATCLVLLVKLPEAKTQALPPGDLTITKAGPSYVIGAPSDGTLSTIVVRNVGSSPITVPSGTVLVRDAHTGNFGATACSFSDPYRCSGRSPIEFVTIADDTIGVGEARRFSTSLYPLLTAVGTTMTNTAEVDPDGVIEETNETNNTSDTVATRVLPPATYSVDLGLATTDRPDPATVRNPLTYVVSITNQGPDPQPPTAIFDDQVPTNTTIVSAEFTKGEGSCVFGNQNISCYVHSSIAVGDTVEIAITVIPQEEGIIENVAVISTGSSTVYDTNLTPDGHPARDRETTTVLGPPEEGPKTKADCKTGGWRDFGFKNQGECIKAVKNVR